ncbi:MAG: hypothetical protein HMLKMBBP_00133 [Planctomycetes bacterium]|nr:hypothetical protein [Planctomycetota bacterium]
MRDGTTGPRGRLRHRGGARLAGGLAAACGLAAAALLGLGATAGASDETAFKALKKEYDDLAKNQDDAAIRGRTWAILRCFDYLDQKACRKWLRDAYGDERAPDPRTAVALMLPAGGDPKDTEFLLGAFKKEKSPGPVIALGEGLSYVPEAGAAAMAAALNAQLARQKGEPQRSLIEGIGWLAQESSLQPLVALGDKLPRLEAYERLVAIGSCGKAKAVPFLQPHLASLEGDVRLAAVTGLALSGAPEALPLVADRLSDLDPRVVEEAANAVGKAKFADAKDALVGALSGAPLRVKEAIRAALREITGKDFGTDPEAWRAEKASASLAVTPSFFGMPVASDRVAVVLDLSRSMDWNGRLETARHGAATYVRMLPPTALVGAVGASRTVVPMGENLVTSKAGIDETAAWIEKQLSGTSFDFREAMLYVTRRYPEADTVVVATDSYPWGDSSEDTPRVVLQELRRDQRLNRLRFVIAFVAPGGRHTESETDAAEFEDRKKVLELLAKSTGGAFTVVEK